MDRFCFVCSSHLIDLKDFELIDVVLIRAWLTAGEHIFESICEGQLRSMRLLGEFSLQDVLPLCDDGLLNMFPPPPPALPQPQQPQAVPPRPNRLAPRPPRQQPEPEEMGRRQPAERDDAASGATADSGRARPSSSNGAVEAAPAAASAAGPSDDWQVVDIDDSEGEIDAFG